MQAVYDLLQDLEEAMNECEQWAEGQACRQRDNDMERIYSLKDFATVCRWISGALNGEPLTAVQIRAARRIIDRSRWHKVGGP